ncbi:MAG: DUF3618 domain-containing protein [Congregibacter sp.]
MNNDTRTQAEIERDIERDRNDLNSTLNDLKDQFSIDALLRESGGPLKELGGDMSRALARSARQNPMAVMLAGVGIAWMILDRNDRDERDYRRNRGGTLGWYGQSADESWEAPYDKFGQAGDSTPARGSDEDLSLAREGRTGHGQPEDFRMSDEDEGGLLGAVKDSAASAKQSLADRGESVGSSVNESVARMQSSLSQVSRRLAEGTESLSAEGRQRVIEARRRALAAREELRKSATRRADSLQDFFDQQPLIGGALALAFGAALGGALPRTEMEDDAMGERSDALMKAAQRVYAEELANAKKVGAAVVEEGERAARDVRDRLDETAPSGKTAVDAIADKVKDSASRIVEAGKSEAQRQDLGKSVKSVDAS